jgi:hypothetical protein
LSPFGKLDEEWGHLDLADPEFKGYLKASINIFFINIFWDIDIFEK